MDPTSLPTDNLYKFWALAFLLAAGSVLYFARKRARELHEHKDALELEIKKHNRRIAHLNADVDAGVASNERKREAEIAATEAEHKVVTLDRLITDAKASENRSLFMLFASFAMAMVGFYFWYVKAQTHQDAATLYALREQKAKAELAELELNEKRKGASQR